MSDNLHYYRSELKFKNISKYKLIGISSELILETSLFPKNENLISFLYDVFKVTFKDYVIKSRTMIVARTIRLIYNMNSNEFETCRKLLLDFVSNSAPDLSEKVSRKRRPDNFEKWMDGINDKGN